jgi:hypothetical protein
MSKISRTNQHFAVSSAPESDERYPQLEEIKRTLFPLLVGVSSSRRDNPRFADMVEQFAVRRSA